MPSGFKRFIVAADNHGLHVDREACEKFLSFANDWKPHYRIHLGDLWDFGPLRKKASAEEKADGLLNDYNEGLLFLDKFKPQYLTLGNHDFRLWRAAQETSEGVLADLCRRQAMEAEDDLRKRRIQWCEYKVDAYLRMPEGGPRLIHGFRSTMYPAKAHFENWGPCLHGHVHKPDHYTARHVEGGESFSVGTLADLRKLSYADHTPAKLGWRNGWLYGMIHTKTGNWKAWQVIKEGGTWISPMGTL